MVMMQSPLLLWVGYLANTTSFNVPTRHTTAITPTISKTLLTVEFIFIRPLGLIDRDKKAESSIVFLKNETGGFIPF
jgi:hypothetical protein